MPTGRRLPPTSRRERLTLAQMPYESAHDAFQAQDGTAHRRSAASGKADGPQHGKPCIIRVEKVVDDWLSMLQYSSPRKDRHESIATQTRRCGRGAVTARMLACPMRPYSLPSFRVRGRDTMALFLIQSLPRPESFDIGLARQSRLAEDKA